MAFTIRIEGHEGPLTVDLGQTILDASMAQGGPFPYSCRAGNCGTCKCRLVAGEVEMTPYSEFALSDAERARGLVLACRAVPWSDCEIALLGADDQVIHPERDMICHIAVIEPLTHDIRRVELVIESGGPFTFSPGQYAEVAFESLPARDFSMASQPDEERLRFYIRLYPGGAVGSYLATKAAVGAPVRVKGPYGSAFLREGRRTPLLAIAGGSGLAPIQAIIDRAVALDWEQPIHVYFGARGERDLYLLDHFDRLRARLPSLAFTPVLSEPEGETDRRTGLVTDAVRADLADLAGFTAYLAGPPPMIEAAERMLPGLGIDPADIHADAFYTTHERDKDAAE
ncbi:MAG: oxidoreductase [Alphaproteobacteria bacterium]|nr:MAG: oxidoreductase [Alphaproteobacteria bacterium]